jgi:hypothetical protein
VSVSERKEIWIPPSAESEPDKSLDTKRGTVDRSELENALEEALGGSEEQRRVVSRQARDLADARQYEADQGVELTVPTTLSNLEDAPEGSDLVARWNWWMGSLEVAYGGYERFQIRKWALD